MKFLSYVTIAALSAATLFYSCKNDGDAARDAAVQSVAAPQPAGDAATAAPATNPAASPEPAQNAAGVWHYTCPKGCAGGAGTAAACAKCGTTLAHNAAYHPTPSPTTATPSTTLPPGFTQVPNPAATKAPEPPQNAAGVWHYTCSGGCAGGAGSAVACAKCGKTLAHNQAYHL